MMEKIQKIKKISLGTQLTDSMISMVEDGTWALGEKLPNEIELSASFSVSRNIMRESMKILENHGILRSKAGLGTFVSDSALGSIRSMRFLELLKNNTVVESLLETRLVIEPDMAYYAALRCTDEQLEVLASISEVCKRRRISTDFFHMDDFDFHSAIAKYCGNSICENLLLSIFEQLKMSDYSKFNAYVDKTIAEKGFHDHDLIFDAIKGRDPLLAKERMHDHLFSRIKVINPSYGNDLAASKRIEKSRHKGKA